MVKQQSKAKGGTPQSVSAAIVASGEALAGCTDEGFCFRT